MKGKFLSPINLPQFNTINTIKTYKNNKKKKLKKLKLNEQLNLFSFDEEYVSKLKYYSPDLSLKGNKKETLYNINTSGQVPTIFKKYQIEDSKNYEENKRKLMSRINIKKQMFENRIYAQMEHTRYVGRLENMYRENTLEKKRQELEEKIKKIKSLIEPLSKELSDILRQIENYKIDLEIFNNYKNLLDKSVKKRFLYRESKSNLNIFNNINNDNNISDKKSKLKKEKEKKIIQEMIKTKKKSLIEEHKFSKIEKLALLHTKKSNILIKLDSCEKDLKEFKERLNLIKNELLVHYHKLLLEGKDTRKEGLSWIIKSIWNLKSNVIMSFMPKFLDMNSISFLFIYSDKLVEIEKMQKTIEKINDEIKKREKKSKKLAHLSNMILKRNKRSSFINYLDNNNNIKDYNTQEGNVKENKIKEIKKKNNINDILKNKEEKGDRSVEIDNINNFPILRGKTVKMKPLKRLLSQVELCANDSIIKSPNIKEKQKTLSDFNKNFDKTFKTSLYKTSSQNNSVSSFSSEISKNSDKKNDKVNINIKKMLKEPEYLEQLTSHLSPQKKIKVKDYENFKSFKLEDSFDSELLNLFRTHKEMIKKLKIMKNEADKLVRKELDRIGKCFYLEDYEGKFNTKLKIVIGALIGEDNTRNEILRQEKEQREYFRTIKSIRNFNGFNFKEYN